MQKQSLNNARKARFLGAAVKCQQSNAVLGNNLYGFVWHCHRNPAVPQPPPPPSWNEPDCGTDPTVNIIFLIDEERWCLLLLKCSHSHRRCSATVISLEKLLLGAGWLLLSHCRVRQAPVQAQGKWWTGCWMLEPSLEVPVLLMFRFPKSL